MLVFLLRLLPPECDFWPSVFAWLTFLICVGTSVWNPVWGSSNSNCTLFILTLRPRLTASMWMSPPKSKTNSTNNHKDKNLRQRNTNWAACPPRLRCTCIDHMKVKKGEKKKVRKKKRLWTGSICRLRAGCGRVKWGMPYDFVMDCEVVWPDGARAIMGL